ncbi:MAG: PH domain-containing protein [Alphaproteobacteria bacterium]
MSPDHKKKSGKRKNKGFHYIRSVLMPGEKIIFATTLHWIVYWRALFVTLVGLAFAFGSHQIIEFVFGPITAAEYAQPARYLVMAFVLLGCFLFVTAYIKHTESELAVTDQRVVMKFGLVSRQTYELFLEQIEGAAIEQTSAGRMFHYGCLYVRAYGNGFAPVFDMADPGKFQSALLSQLRNHHGEDKNLSANSRTRPRA